MAFFRSRKPPRYARLEDALSALARRELETGAVRAEVWETALRLAHGDGRRAAAAYVRLRVRALLLAHEALRGTPRSGREPD